jgi:DNA-binding NtrC family response regulator
MSRRWYICEQMLSEGPKVLVADDDEAVRCLCRHLLEGMGMQVLEAADGEQAKAILTTFSHISLLISDVVMPHMSGPALVADVLPKQPELRVLYISCDTQDNRQLRRHVAEWGCSFLEKPFSADEFASRVQHLLGIENGARAAHRAPSDHCQLRLLPESILPAGRHAELLNELRSEVYRLEVLRIEQHHYQRRLRSSGQALMSHVFRAWRISAASEWDSLRAERLAS